MSNIDKRATELLIENGVLVADTLRHLADNEIDSDYFAICHSNENGTEIECELAITDYARQAAGTVDELVNALGAAEKRIAELSALQGKPIAWESTTPVYVKFITDERYQRLRPGYKKWYKPYRCSQCAADGKGEAS